MNLRRRLCVALSLVVTLVTSNVPILGASEVSGSAKPALGGRVAVSTAQKKLADLGALASRDPSFVVSLNATSYNYFALSSPKPYSLALLYTASDKYCPAMCREFSKQFRKIAKEYVRSGAHLGTESELPVVFAEIQLEQHLDVYKMHDFATIPQLAVLGSKSVKKALIPDKANIDPKSFLQATTDERRNLDIIMVNFINVKTGRQVAIHRSVAFSASLLAFLTILLMLIAMVGSRTAMVLRKWPIIVAIGALILQILSTSGLFHSIQNGARLWGYNHQSREYEIFARGQRQQYLGEGVIMAGSTVLAGLGFTGIALCPSFLKKRHLSKTITNVVIMVLFTISFAACKFVWWGHFYKTRFQTGGMFPSPSAARGLLMVDRGNSF